MLFDAPQKPGSDPTLESATNSLRDCDTRCGVNSRVCRLHRSAEGVIDEVAARGRTAFRAPLTWPKSRGQTPSLKVPRSCNVIATRYVTAMAASSAGLAHGNVETDGGLRSTGDS